MGTQRAGGGAPGRQRPAGLCRATACVRGGDLQGVFNLAPMIDLAPQPVFIPPTPQPKRGMCFRDCCS